MGEIPPLIFVFREKTLRVTNGDRPGFFVHESPQRNPRKNQRPSRENVANPHRYPSQID
jgi:hypothetical protein